jgi:hypothetical protein
VGWRVDPHGACTDTDTIPSQNIEAAGDSERGPTKNAPYRARARTRSSPDSPLSTPRASDPLSTSVHHDSLRRPTIDKRPSVACGFVPVADPEPDEIGGFRGSRQRHSRKCSLASPIFYFCFHCGPGTPISIIFRTEEPSENALSVHVPGTNRGASCKRIERTGMPQLSKVIGMRASEVKATQTPMPPPLPRGVCARQRRS